MKSLLSSISNGERANCLIEIPQLTSAAPVKNVQVTMSQ